MSELQFPDTLIGWYRTGPDQQLLQNRPGNEYALSLFALRGLTTMLTALEGVGITATIGMPPDAARPNGLSELAPRDGAALMIRPNYSVDPGTLWIPEAYTQPNAAPVM